MPIFLPAMLFALAAILPLFLYRVLRGPDVFDRLIGLNGIATKSMIFLVLLGAYTGKLDMLVDISLGYGLLNLVGALAVGKYLEKKGLSEE